MEDAPKKALIVEDDPQIAELLSIHVADLHFEPHIIADGLRAIDALRTQNFDLILLDIMLPNADGLDVCKAIRTRSNTPIIMITAKSEEIDKVVGLESGADDYITKPFSIRELKARIRSVLRRSSKDGILTSTNFEILKFENLKIDQEKRIATKDNTRIDLTTKEFDLLSLLASNPGKSFNRKNLLNLIWGYDFQGMEHTVNSHINRLRAKIEEDLAEPKYILTTWGFGYRFNENI